MTPTRTRTPAAKTPTIIPTNTPVPAPLVIRASWSSAAGCRDLNLVVQDPFGATLPTTGDANKGCASCVSNPFEEVSISNPVAGYTYSYRALDSYSAACNCNAGTISSQFSVYRNGVLVKTDPATSKCDVFTPTFRYTY